MTHEPRQILDRHARSSHEAPAPHTAVLSGPLLCRDDFDHHHSTAIKNHSEQDIHVYEAAQESNLPSDGLRRPAGFEGMTDFG